jgi:hypothetical protein
MGARSYAMAVTASILVSMALAGAAAAAPPADSTDFANDPFLLESDYLWTSVTTGYTTFNQEPGTASNPNPTDLDSDCSTTGMQATSWWQIHGTGRRTIISTSWPDTGTNYDTIMAVYEENGNAPGAYVGCVDDIDFPSNKGSLVELATTDPNKDYWIQVGGFNGATGTLKIFASSDAPGNDAQAQAEPVSVGPQSFWENFGATPADVNADCNGTPYGKTVWFRYTSPERGNVAFDVIGGFNTVIGIYGSNGTVFGCGNNIGATNARAETGDQNADTYYLQVGAADDHDDYFASDFDPDEGYFGLEVKFTPDLDDDDDGVLDSQDRCPLSKGSGLVKDCPDPDSDGFADGIDDRCPGLGGRDAGRYQGCPDADGDGVPEGPGGRDACAGLNPASVGRRDVKPNDGCPDILLLHKRVDLSRSVLLARGGIILEFFKVTGVPAGAAVKVVCRRPGGGRCGRKTVRRASTATARARAAKTITAKIDKRLPFGTTITTRTTAPYATGSFIRFKVARNAKGFTERFFCMNHDALRRLRPRSRGCQ